MPERSNIYEKQALELQEATHFMQWVTSQTPSRIRRLDQKKDRSRPEFAFCYPSGQRYTLELTRWLTPELKRLQNFLEKNIAKPLRKNLQGTFVLSIPRGIQITKNQARNLVSEINQKINTSNIKVQTFSLSIGTFAKVRDNGQKLVSTITDPELPAYLDENDEKVEILRSELIRILDETQHKFRHYRSIRVLLLNISQNGLDIGYHAGISKEGPGIIKRWLSKLLQSSTAIDYICLNPGIPVWDGGSGDRILTGHKYENQPPSYYEEVWHRPGFPCILKSFSCTVPKAHRKSVNLSVFGH
ncbi:MAG: hypothetical protein JXB43_09125 [Dehalococcoidia bacterium]|nr:hypothetical protein [Dehalococcoidia bacterium]